MTNFNEKVNELNSQIATLERQFNEKYANYANDKEKLVESVKEIREQIKAIYDDAKNERKAEIAQIDEQLKLFSNSTLSSKRSYKKTSSAIKEITEDVEMNIKGNPDLSSKSPEEAASLVRTITSEAIEKIVPYKRIAKKELIKDEVVRNVLSGLRQAS
jgi:uncharacterized protein YydD (DUF2326 family)